MTKRKLTTLLSIGLGCVFFIAGAAKVPVLAQFSQTVSGIVHLSPGMSRTGAIGVVILELAAGTALLFRYRQFVVSALLCILVGAFLWVLASAVAQGREIQCNCFGILGISLPNRSEMILDLVLFNLLAVLAFLSMETRQHSTFGQKVWSAALGLVLIVLQYTFVGFVFEGSSRSSSVDVEHALAYAEMHHREFGSSAGSNRLLMLLNFSDFNCPPCFDSFVDLCDSMKAQLPDSGRNRVLALFRAGEVADPRDPTPLKRWAQANELLFPMLIAPDSLFESIHVQKSAVVVLGPSGRARMLRVLPIEQADRAAMLRILRNQL